MLYRFFLSFNYKNPQTSSHSIKDIFLVDREEVRLLEVLLWVENWLTLLNHQVSWEVWEDKDELGCIRLGVGFQQNAIHSKSPETNLANLYFIKVKCHYGGLVSFKSSQIEIYMK